MKYMGLITHIVFLYIYHTNLYTSNIKKNLFLTLLSENISTVSSRLCVLHNSHKFQSDMTMEYDNKYANKYIAYIFFTVRNKWN